MTYFYSKRVNFENINWKIICNKNSRILQHFLMLKRSIIHRFLNCIAKKLAHIAFLIYSRNQFVFESIHLSKENISPSLNQELPRGSSLKTRLFESYPALYNKKLWAMLFVCGVIISQADHWFPKTICTSSHTKKIVPKALLKPVPKSRLEHKQRTFFTLLTFYGESYLSNIS